MSSYQLQERVQVEIEHLILIFIYYTLSNIMKYLIHCSVVLLCVLCFAEATEQKPEQKSTVKNYDLSCDEGGIGGIGGPSYPILTCTFVQVFILFAYLICTMFRLIKDVGAFLECVMCLLPHPFDSIIGGIFDQIGDGGELTFAVCPGIVDQWTKDVRTLCPNLYDSVNNVLDQLLQIWFWLSWNSIYESRMFFKFQDFQTKIR